LKMNCVFELQNSFLFFFFTFLKVCMQKILKFFHKKKLKFFYTLVGSIMTFHSLNG